MLEHNSYFEGKVQSVGFERNGRRATAGVIDAGEFQFGTQAAERMTVVSGELQARLPGEAAFRAFPAGTAFEVPARGGFDMKASARQLVPLASSCSAARPLDAQCSVSFAGARRETTREERLDVEGLPTRPVGRDRLVVRRRHHDDRDPGGRRVLSCFAPELAPVHHGHREVQENERWMRRCC